MTEENPKKKSRIFDKVVMGAIIGGAIGSVIGASVRVKKEESVIEEATEELEKAKNAPRTVFRAILGMFRRKKHHETTKEIPNEMEEYRK
jgi:hypothetical protein